MCLESPHSLHLQSSFRPLSPGSVDDVNLPEPEVERLAVEAERRGNAPRMREINQPGIDPMIKRLTIPALLGAWLLAASQTGPAVAAPVAFAAADGVRIFADLEKPSGATRGAILLLHMAGSNQGEYETIAPELNRMGFATLTIDLRSGGTLWGRHNKTVEALGGSASYAEAIPDIEAGLDYAKTHSAAPVALWGSSYTSALVFVVAARHPEVAAVLAFSPAEYIAGYSIHGAAAKLTVPVLVMSAPDENEVASAKAIAGSVPNGLAVQAVPRAGVHGSSTLRTDQNPDGATENMKVVEGFLDRVLPQR